MGMGPPDETARREMILHAATGEQQQQQLDSQQQTGKDSVGSSGNGSSPNPPADATGAKATMPPPRSAGASGLDQMELVDVPPYQQSAPASGSGSASASSNGPSSAAMPPPVGVPAPKAGGPPVPNTNEMDEPPNSSPARSSAAMALASMFHIKPANPNDTSKVGYAFPLDDNHPFPGVAAPAAAAAAAAASHTRRSSSSSNGAASGGNGTKRAAAGSNGGSRKGSPASLGGETDAEPQRKRERRSPLEGAAPPPANPAEMAAVWARQQAEAGALHPNGHHLPVLPPFGHPAPYGSPHSAAGSEGMGVGGLGEDGGDDASEGSRRSGRRSSASLGPPGAPFPLGMAPPHIGHHPLGLPLPPPGVFLQDAGAMLGMYPPHPGVDGLPPPPLHFPPPPFIGDHLVPHEHAAHAAATAAAAAGVPLAGHIPSNASTGVGRGRGKKSTGGGAARKAAAAAGAAAAVGLPAPAPARGGGGGPGALQGPGGAAYSRKEKSLGLLCENFIKRFGEPAMNEPNHEGISLDSAAKILNVERRRIYDIINILESICYVERKCKNTYWWYGARHLASTLKQLQEDGFALWPDDARRNGVYPGAGAPPPGNGPNTLPEIATSQGQEAIAAAAAAAATAAALEEADRKEKSLGRLTQKFIQLFLVGFEVISLSGAAEKLLGASPQSMNEKGMKTKVRRLYDIANVLTSLRLIDKIQVGDSRKPSFRWVGTPPAVVLLQPPYEVGGAAQFPGVPGLTPPDERLAATQAANEERQQQHRGQSPAAGNEAASEQGAEGAAKGGDGKAPSPTGSAGAASGRTSGRRASKEKAKEAAAAAAAAVGAAAAVKQEDGPSPGAAGLPPLGAAPSPPPPPAPLGPFITTGDATAPLITTTGHHAHADEMDVVHGLMPLAPTPSPPALPPPPPPGVEGSGGPPSGGSGSGGMTELWIAPEEEGKGVKGGEGSGVKPEAKEEASQPGAPQQLLV